MNLLQTYIFEFLAILLREVVDSIHHVLAGREDIFNGPRVFDGISNNLPWFTIHHLGDVNVGKIVHVRVRIILPSENLYSLRLIYPVG